MTQSDALDILKSGANVFLSGSAGSGKTYVLNKYIDYLKAHDIAYAVTASTGIAATHLGGVTIHSWSGIGVRETITDYDLETMQEKKYLYDRLNKLKVLIIDEISMLHAKRLDMVDHVLRTLRRRDAPFGGVQVVLSGDFFQLPPVTKRTAEEKNLDDEFAFRAEVWGDLNLIICYLEEQHRQTDDGLVRVLNEMRSGELSEDAIELLRSRFADEPVADSQATKLYPHNVDVDVINASEYAKLSGPEHVYNMHGKGNPQLVEAMKSTCLAPAELRLREGALVMFVKNNFEEGYVNGTLGEVIGFDSDNGFPIVLTKSGEQILAAPMDWHIEDNGKVLAEIAQIPLRYAWAITVHKSQGMSLDSVEMDLSKAFAPGQVYVALSRARTLKGLTLYGINFGRIAVSEAVRDFDIEMQTLSQKHTKEFTSFDQKRKEELHIDFIRASGGSLTPVGPKIKVPKIPSENKTLELLKQGMTVAEIAKERGLVIGTIVSHLEKMYERGDEMPTIPMPFSKDDLHLVSDAYTMVKTSKLTPLKNYLEKKKSKLSFEDIRLARILLAIPRDSQE